MSAKKKPIVWRCVISKRVKRIDQRKDFTSGPEVFQQLHVCKFWDPELLGKLVSETKRKKNTKTT